MGGFGGGGSFVDHLADAGTGVSNFGGPFSTNSVMGQLFGTGQNPGMLGVGQYQANNYNINADPFTNNQQLQDLQNAFGQQAGQAQGRDSFMIGKELPNTVLDQANTITTIPQLNTAPADQVRAQQMALAQSLQNTANGQGPSVAQAQLQQAMNQNLQQAVAMQASARGGAGGGLALRNIANQRNDLAAQAGNQSALLRAQEAQAAQAQLGGLLGNVRGADLSTAQQNAGLTQQAYLANQQAINNRSLMQGQLTHGEMLANQSNVANQRALNDAMSRFYTQNQMGAVTQAQQNQQELERLRSGQSVSNNQIAAGAYQNTAKNRAGFIGALGQGAGFMGMQGGAGAAAAA